ncbi:unnamed protein product, partial [Ixodes pacificus]
RSTFARPLHAGRSKKTTGHEPPRRSVELVVPQTHHPHSLPRCSSHPRHQHRPCLQRTSGNLRRSLPDASRNRHNILVHSRTG